MRSPEEAAAAVPRKPLVSCGCCGDDASAAVGEMGGVGIRRCRSCGTRRFDSIVDQDHVYLDGYHTGANTFGWDWADEESQAYQQALADLQLAWIEPRVGKGALLDVGGGLGHFAAAAARRGWDATLLEPVAQAVDFATRTFGIRAVQGTVDTALASDDRYDVVSFVHCLEHLPPALDVMRDVRHLLAPGGHVYIEVPNYGSLPRRTLGSRWQGWQPGEHVYLFDRSTLVSLLERAGYQVVDAGSVAPVWRGLTPDTYAYFVGASPLLNAAVGVRRRLRRRPVSGPGPAAAARPIDEATGVRKLVFDHGLRLCRAVEERTGLATNIRLLARP
jgi:2-polyprenyl-3-methyl-5-hydroxy-6-metoxy-1,4-benzoquinol methylase